MHSSHIQTSFANRIHLLLPCTLTSLHQHDRSWQNNLLTCLASPTSVQVSHSNLLPPPPPRRRIVIQNMPARTLSLISPHAKPIVTIYPLLHSSRDFHLYRMVAIMGGRMMDQQTVITTIYVDAGHLLLHPRQMVKSNSQMEMSKCLDIPIVTDVNY